MNTYANQLRADADLSIDELEQRYSPDGGGEHPTYKRAEWHQAVANDHTLSGYWSWVHHLLMLD